jgi:two-component system cell cycle response regulator DivK
MDKRQAHIVIVDDLSDDRHMYAHYLTRKGYRGSTAHDGKEGLEKAFWLIPDLILLDLCLPKISGWEFNAAPKSKRKYQTNSSLGHSGPYFSPPTWV